jgi:RNA polymerase sigma-70 factor (ECF subfamily)
LGGREGWSELPDGVLAEHALSGESRAWDEISRRHSRRVIVSLLARGIDLAEAEDLTQDVWLRLIQQQRAGKLQTLLLPGLAIAQALWLARERIRTLRRRDAILGSSGELELREEPTGTAADPEALAVHRERLDTVRRALMQCSERDRLIFQATYGPEPRLHSDLARELGLSIQRVRQVLCQVRARLREALDSRDREETR